MIFKLSNRRGFLFYRIYDILNVMFEKNHRDDLRIFESKQSKTETPKIILWIYGIEVV